MKKRLNQNIIKFQNSANSISKVKALLENMSIIFAQVVLGAKSSEFFFRGQNFDEYVVGRFALEFFPMTKKRSFHNFSCIVYITHWRPFLNSFNQRWLWDGIFRDLTFKFRGFGIFLGGKIRKKSLRIANFWWLTNWDYRGVIITVGLIEVIPSEIFFECLVLSRYYSQTTCRC